MATTINDLQTSAQTIHDATEVGENTAQRVGGAFEQAADLIADLITRVTAAESNGTTQSGKISVLQSAIISLQTALNTEAKSRGDADTAETTARQNADKELKKLIDTLTDEVNTLTGTNASDAIDNFNEVIKFLDGIKDNEHLSALLSAINTRIAAIETAAGKTDGGDFRLLEHEVLLSELDSMTDTYFMTNGKPTRYRVISETTTGIKYVVGVLVVFSDNMGHQITQVFTSHFVLDDDNTFSSHKDEEIYSYFRSYGIKAAHITNGEWTKWKSTSHALQDELNNMEKNVGQANGLLALNSDAKVDDKYLPDSVNDVISCAVWDETPTDGGSTTFGTKEYGYNTSAKKLFQAKFKAGINSDGTTYKGFYWESVDLSAKRIYIDANENIPYRWNGQDMVAIAAKNAPASIFNATIEVPINGYYTLCDTENTTSSAVHAAWNQKKAVSGLIISFELSAGIWKTYQYVGKSVTETNWYDPDNWKDFGSLAAGSETYIIIDGLCGTPAVGTYYTLETAVQALLAYQQKSGVTYAKKGLIISYTVGENKMETKQFQGEVTDFGTVGLWKDFGGGSEVVAKDEVAENGKDALSTGGGYELIPADMQVDTETQGTVKLQMVNAGGKPVGNQVSFSVGTGTGGGGNVITVAFKNSPLYAAAGGSFVLEAAIRSVTVSGSQEQTFNIEKIEIYDRDTNQLLETRNINQASSADMETFDFSIDVSSYFKVAGQRRFKIVVYDDAGNTGSRNVNIVAVDVTITSAQTLNYTQSTALTVGGETKMIPMYQFANNASDKGILAIIEAWDGGKWQTLAQATITDTFTHSITIDPNNVLSTSLAHGALPLRIHGEDVSSGVVGNYLYTAVMCVGSVSTPIAVARWYANEATPTVKLYESISIDFAVYDPTTTSPSATVYFNDDTAETITAYRSRTYTFTKKITGVKYDGSVTVGVNVKCGTASSQTASFVVNGTLLGVEDFKTQEQFALDFSERSNSESDHTIANNGVTMSLTGCNWSTTGFVTDNFGTTAESGDMALRIAEDVTGELSYKPFADTDIETNGMAFMITLMKKNIANDDTRLVECIGGGFGFWIDGQDVVLTFDGAPTDDNGKTIVAHTIVAKLQDGQRTNVAIVIEPTSRAPYAGIGVAKIYFDGEEIGACYYSAGTIVAHNATVKFNGTQGDLYVYNMRAWKTYFSFEQAFNNYLLQMPDSDGMISEYQFNQVIASQTAENTTKSRPQAAKLYALGIPYFVICKNPDTADNDAKDNYPEYIESLDGDKKTSRLLDLYAYFPDRPWQDFKAVAVPTTNQGTTSSRRPIKNIKMKFKKCKSMELVHTEADFTGDDLEKFKECQALIAKHKVKVKETSLPTNIITVKVDFSESGGANNGASTNLYNDLQRALGSDYMTPAQNAYTGDGELNTSIDSIPCAFFRTDKYSEDATSPSYGYFHAKANWNCDKGDAAFYGFEKCAGYNDGCLNYGDFVELVGNKGESITDFAARVDKSTWVSENVYVLSEFCGAGHRVYRYKDGAWKDTTGNMTYTNGKWVITGDVVNPVECYELLKYDALDWFQGVNSVDDMLTLDTDGKPIWLQYFESRYPDDDDLNALYEAGKKVPYNLYTWLRFCQDCNHHLTADNGNITLGGVSVAGTAENRLKKWKQELHTVANVHSLLCYDAFTDYIAAVDQRSKNMMIGFYLDTDGVERMYLNHLYDGDTIMGSDNDCGLTVPVLIDPNNDEGGVYQGHDSVLFMQTAAVGTDAFWLNDDGSETITLRQVVAKMRSTDCGNGLIGFSYDGIVKYWVTDRLSKWPKVVSSFDGERKYIEHSTATTNYFYALHGLSIQRLKDFAKTRFAYRDGFYQCGDLFNHSVSFRATGTDIKIKIRAAKDGYFAVGVDRANSATDSAYLKAGEEYTLKTGATNTGSGVMLYVFGADKLAMLDISGCTPSAQSLDFSQLVLLQEFYIGGENYKATNNQQGAISALSLPNLPYLKILDIRKTAITTADLTYCPRLQTLYAAGSMLQRADIATTAKVTRLQLPATYTWLQLRYLPDLTNDGLTFEGTANLERIVIEECAKLDAIKLLNTVLASTNVLKYVRITGLSLKGDGSDLATWYAAGLKGIDATLSGITDYPELIGTYQLTKYTDTAQIKTWQAYFADLTIKQQAYTAYKENDLVTDQKNISNLDNLTGYDYGNDYVPSGHILRIHEKSTPVKGKFNSSTGKMHMTAISRTDFTKYADGTAFDNTDQLGEQYDVFMYIPHYWYKGVNDFKNQCKYTLLSSNKEEPAATWTKKNEDTLANLIYADGKGISASAVSVGSTLDESAAFLDVTNCGVYRLDVEGMKQARYVGINSASYTAIMTDASGKILAVYTLAVVGTTDSPLDFKNENSDYVFNDVPDGAKWLYFTCLHPTDATAVTALAVDSDDIEAIEPGWVEHKSELIGVYGGSVDDLGLLRSISGRKTRTGDGTSTTSTEWQYDSDGNPTNMPTTTPHYTYQDLFNLCRYRGKGYQSIDMEQNKALSIFFRCWYGNRNDQYVIGFGTGSQYTTGTKDSKGMNDTVYGVDTGVNKFWGIEGVIACNWEILDNVGVNISTFKEWKALKRSDSVNTMPIDGKFHIYDPHTDTERVVQGLTSGGGNNIARLKHGRYCDYIPSATTTDTSKYSLSYGAGFWYSAVRGRVVGRASYSASAYGGFVCADAVFASSHSGSSSGARLAYCGAFDNESDIDEEA